jgi:hypothetical protein
MSFYNLTVVKYPFKGDNEFRLYDVLGIVIIFCYLKYVKLIKYKSNRIKYFRKTN